VDSIVNRFASRVAQLDINPDRDPTPEEAAEALYGEGVTKGKSVAAEFMMALKRQFAYRYVKDAQDFAEAIRLRAERQRYDFSHVLENEHTMNYYFSFVGKEPYERGYADGVEQGIRRAWAWMEKNGYATNQASNPSTPQELASLIWHGKPGPEKPKDEWHRPVEYKIPKSIPEPHPSAYNNMKSPGYNVLGE